VDLEQDPLGDPLGVLNGPVDCLVAYPSVRADGTQRRQRVAAVPRDQFVVEAYEED
jgi:hypothetical protein